MGLLNKIIEYFLINEIKDISKINNDSIFIINKDGIIIYMNKYAYRLFKYSSKEILNKNICDLIIPNYYFNEESNCSEFLFIGKLLPINKRIKFNLKDKLNKEFKVEIFVVPRKVLNNTYYFIQIKDISYKEIMEKELIEKSKDFNTLISEFPFGLMLMKENKIIYINQKFIDIFSYQLDDLKDLSEWERISNDNIISKLDSISYEYCNLRCKEGKIKHFRTKIIKLINNIYVKVFDDITDQKKSNESLIISEQRLNEILTNIDLVAIMLDLNGNIIYCNEFFLKTVQLGIDDVLGKNWFDSFLLKEEKIKYSLMFDEFLKGKINLKQNINCIVTNSNEQRMISWNNIVIKDSDKKIIGIASIGADITKLKKLEDQYYLYKKNEIIGNFIENITHTLNNLLFVILGNVEGLHNYSVYPDQQLDYEKNISKIINYISKMKNFIKQLLLFNNEKYIKYNIVCLSKLILEMKDFIRNIVSENIKINFDLCENDMFVKIDRNLIKQLILNIVNNSQDSIQKRGEIVIKTGFVKINQLNSAVYENMEYGNYVLLRFLDTGCGIDKNDLSQIFEPFFTTKKTKDRLGLGLFLVYNIVKQHNGNIFVTSEVGEGTIIDILFKECSEDEVEGFYDENIIEQGNQEVKDIPNSKQDLKGSEEKIVLVEDDNIILNILQLALRENNYDICSINSIINIEEVIDACFGIDLLVTDIVMPSIHGDELYAILLKKYPGLKVLFISGYPESIIIKRLEKFNNNYNLLCKPFGINEFLAKIKSILKK